MTEAIAYHFWSQTCPPCNAIKPVIADLKEEFNTVQWISIDIKNDQQEYGKKFDVRFVPTVVVVGKNGQIGKHSGTAVAGYYRILRAGII